jgi:hypothetical protein
MERILYFAEADVLTGNDFASEAICVPAKNLVGTDVAAGAVKLFFKGAMGDEDANIEIRIGCTDGNQKEVLREVMSHMNAGNVTDGFVNVLDFEDTTNHTGGTKTKKIGRRFEELGVSDVAITDTALSLLSTGTSAGSTWDSYGIGAVSTAGTPTYHQYRDKGDVITEIYVYLDGLTCKGDAADDVIGLTGGSKPAYIGRYTQGNMGILYKAEVACIEVPGQQTATITTDIDIAFNTSGTLEYDGAAGTSEINTGGFSNAGDLYIGGFVSAPAANDYIYLTEGDTSATTGEYSTGKLLIRLYGRQLTW